MNANQQSALAALKAVEPIVVRLDRSREAEDRAADILELWQGTETALRTLMGGSALSGQGLIRELRQREMISLGQACISWMGCRRWRSSPGLSPGRVARPLSHVMPRPSSCCAKAPKAAAASGHGLSCELTVLDDPTRARDASEIS